MNCLEITYIPKKLFAIDRYYSSLTNVSSELVHVRARFYICCLDEVGFIFM